MLPILLGAGAALCWGSAGAMVSRAVPRIGAPAAVAVVLLTGLVVLLPFLAISGTPEVGPEAGVWLSLGAIGEVGGLAATYYAFRLGRVGVVGPIASTAGGLASLIAVAAGEPLGVIQGLSTVAIVAGVMLASRSNLEDDEAVRDERRSVVFALLGAMLVALGMFATGRAGLTLDVAWAILPPRIMGFVALIVAIRLRFTPSLLPIGLAMAAGLCEVVGFALFTHGAGTDASTTSLLTSFSGIVSATIGLVLFKERLGYAQVLGMLFAVAGVAMLAASST